jgi:hypothetical protein
MSKRVLHHGKVSEVRGTIKRGMEMTWEDIGAALDPPCSKQAAFALFESGMAKLRWVVAGVRPDTDYSAPDPDAIALLREIDRLRGERRAGEDFGVRVARRGSVNDDDNPCADDVARLIEEGRAA